MARTFNGTSRLVVPSQSVATAVPLTMACFFKADDDTTSQSFFSASDTDSTGSFYLRIMGSVAGDYIRFYAVQGGTSYCATSSAGFTANTWHHACGVTSASNNRKVYLDGGNSGSSSGSTTPTGVDNIVIGGRLSSSSFTGFAGAIAEAAIWNVALTAAEAAVLAAGLCPLFMHPESLVYYAPLHGRGGAASDEEDWVGGLSASQTSSPGVADHPRIIYPRRRSDIWVPAAAGGAPTITDLKAVNITATTVQATYDYAF